MINWRLQKEYSNLCHTQKKATEDKRGKMVTCKIKDN